MAPTRAILALTATASLAGCFGSDTTSSDDTTTTDPADVDSTSAAPPESAPEPTVTDPAENTTGVETTTTAAPSPTVESTASASTTNSPASSVETTDPVESTAPPSSGSDGSSKPPADNLLSPTIQIPTGEFIDAPGDLVVVRTNGDLEYWPNGLAPAPSNRADPILLLDRPDPRPAPSEGSGPNIVSDVAGLIDGAVLYADCCEPVSGNLFAIDAPGSDVGPIAVGSTADLSPDGSRLATASGMQVAVFDTSTGDGIGILVEPDTSEGEALRSIVDLEWIDDDVLMALTNVDGTYRLSRYDATSLRRDSAEPAVHDSGGDVDVRFAGRTADGLVGVAVDDGDQLTVEYFDSETSSNDLGSRIQTFPPTVSAIEIEPEGLGQVWVDGGMLYYLGPGRFEARPLGEDVRAAWFVETN